MLFQALTAESCAAAVTEPLAHRYFILARKAIVTTNYNCGGGGVLQPLKALLERASTPRRMVRCLGICLRTFMSQTAYSFLGQP